MNATIVTLLGTLLVVQAVSATPPKGVLQVDNALFKDRPIFCEEEILAPRKSDFEIVDYDLLSSEGGERYAIMNIRNTSSGQRILRKENLVAIFANCNSLYPENINQSLSGRETVTKSISFGINQFPIIKIITGNEQQHIK